VVLSFSNTPLNEIAFSHPLNEKSNTKRKRREKGHENRREEKMRVTKKREDDGYDADTKLCVDAYNQPPSYIPPSGSHLSRCLSLFSPWPFFLSKPRRRPSLQTLSFPHPPASLHPLLLMPPPISRMKREGDTDL